MPQDFSIFNPSPKALTAFGAAIAVELKRVPITAEMVGTLPGLTVLAAESELTAERNPMDTSISRIDEDNEAPAFTSLRLDALDILASLAVRHGPLDDESLAILSKVSAKERIYVALAADRMEILHSLNLTIAEAIDRLGWADASAMVARWRNRRA